MRARLVAGAAVATFCITGTPTIQADILCEVVAGPTEARCELTLDRCARRPKGSLTQSRWAFADL
jgi:hypothetical protein